MRGHAAGNRDHTGARPRARAYDAVVCRRRQLPEWPGKMARRRPDGWINGNAAGLDTAARERLLPLRTILGDAGCRGECGGRANRDRVGNLAGVDLLERTIRPALARCRTSSRPG